MANKRSVVDLKNYGKYSSAMSGKYLPLIFLIMDKTIKGQRH